MNLTMAQSLKQLDIENTVEWQATRLLRAEQTSLVPMMILSEDVSKAEADNGGVLVPTAPHKSTAALLSAWRSTRRLTASSLEIPSFLRHDDLEIRALHLPQFLVQDVNARIGRDRDGPVNAVVGNEHAVSL